MPELRHVTIAWLVFCVVAVLWLTTQRHPSWEPPARQGPRFSAVHTGSLPPTPSTLSSLSGQEHAVKLPLSHSLGHTSSTVVRNLWRSPPSMTVAHQSQPPTAQQQHQLQATGSGAIASKLPGATPVYPTATATNKTMREEPTMSTATAAPPGERALHRQQVALAKAHSAQSKAKAKDAELYLVHKFPGRTNRCNPFAEKPRDAPEMIAARHGVVELTCVGRWGNRLGEYILARIIAEGLNFGLRTCPELADQLAKEGHILPNAVGLDYNQTAMAALPREVYKGHRYPVHDMLRDATPRRIALGGYPFEDYTPFREYRRHIRERWFAVNTSCIDEFHVNRPGPHDVVVHVRAYKGCGANAVGKVSEQFVDLTVEYYSRILDTMREQEAWDTLWVACHCGANHPTVAALAARYGARVAPMMDYWHEMGDWLFLRAATRLVMSQSTFSWWAAYLGDAREVHYPLVGDWWAGKQPRHQLWPDDDARYVFHDVINGRYFLRYEDLGPPAQSASDPKSG